MTHTTAFIAQANLLCVLYVCVCVCVSLKHTL